MNTIATPAVRRCLAATAAAIAVAGVAVVTGEQGALGGQPRPAATALAESLCTHLTAGGPSLVVVGPRLRWHHRSPEESAPQVGLALVKAVGGLDDVLVAGRGRWVVVHDRARGAAVRLDCAAKQRTVIELPENATSIDISDSGEVTTLGIESVAVSIPPAAENRKDALVKVPRPSLGGLGDVMWTGGQLFAFGSATAVWIDVKSPDPPSYVTTAVPLGSSGDVRHAFWYNGLIYVLRDNCFDLFVGVAFSHQVVRAACFSGSAASYFVSTRTRLTALTSSGEQVWSAPRPTVALATFNGKMHDVMDAVSTLAAAPWMPNPPMMLDGSPQPATIAADTRTSEWRRYLDRRYWSSPETFEAGMKAIGARGWNAGVVHQEGLSLRAVGVSARWDNTYGRVLPEGRTLTQIAKDVYGQGYFSDTQVHAIWSGSGALSETLEGRLFDDGWVPAATRAPMASTMGFSLPTLGGRTTVQHVERELLPYSTVKEPPLYNCRPSSTRLDEKLIFALKRGTKVAGGLGLLSEAVRGAGTSVDLVAPDLAVVDCEADGVVNTSVLVAQNAQLRTTPSAKGATDRKPSIRWPASLNITPLAGAESQWQVQGPLVIGTRPANPMGRDLDPVLLRPLLDRVLPGHQSLLLVPVTRLQMAVAAPQDWQERAVRIPHVEIDPAESMPAQTRGTDAGCEAEMIAQQRQLQESILKWPARDTAPRKTQRVMGLAENAVRRDHPALTLTDQGSVWAVPAESGGFDPFNPQNPPLGDSRMSTVPIHLDHGTRVAGLLIAQTELRGLLDSGVIAWVNTADNLPNNRSVLDRLVAKKSILNVSVGLNDDWGPRDTVGMRTPEWAQGLLIIAAAANLNSNGVHGAPLSWRMANVIGVGIVDGKGVIPDGAPYSPSEIDLVAPGVQVPLHKSGGGMECLDGTSYATAHVTAVAALLSESAIQRNPAAIRARLLATADWDPKLYAGKVKGGLLNADRALRHLHKNVLTVRPAPGANDELLFAELPQSGAGTFEVSGTKDGKLFTAPIDWLRLLRLQRLATSTPAAPKYRVAYVTLDGQFIILDEVTIDEAVVAPFSGCVTVKDTPATCKVMSVHRINDFVAALSTDDIVKF